MPSILKSDLKIEIHTINKYNSISKGLDGKQLKVFNDMDTCNYLLLIYFCTYLLVYNCGIGFLIPFLAPSGLII